MEGSVEGMALAPAQPTSQVEGEGRGRAEPLLLPVLPPVLPRLPAVAEGLGPEVELIAGRFGLKKRKEPK